MARLPRAALSLSPSLSPASLSLSARTTRLFSLQPSCKYSTASSVPPATPPPLTPTPYPSSASHDDVMHQRRWASTTPPAPIMAQQMRPKTAIFFPGQGVQKVGMLTPWLEAFPITARDTIQEIDHYMGFKLSDVIQDGPGKRLTATAHAQPAIMATSILILRILEREYNFRVADRFDVTLGHSLGEFAALVAGGYLQFEDSLYLVRRRAEAMARATQRVRDEHGGEYGMVAVVTEPEYMGRLVTAIHGFLDGTNICAPTSSSMVLVDKTYLKNAGAPPSQQLSIANINSKNQIVLSGSIQRIGALMDQVRLFLGHDPRAVRLNSDSPFHSPIMRSATDEIRQLLAGRSRVKGREHEDIVTFPGTLPCISNVTARPFASLDDTKELLALQCEETVHWWDSIRYLDQEQRVRRWVGIGPGKVGRNLVGKEVGMRGKDLVKGGGVWAITDPSEIEEVLRGLEETESVLDIEEEDEDWGERYHH